jgi:plasmid stabilization system protein ParE
MSLRVRISRRAERDIREIQDWIKARSIDGARNWLDALDQALAKLPRHATSSAAAAEADDLGIDLRQRLFKTRRGRSYRLLFVVRDETVQVLSVRGPGQDWLRQDDIEIIE